ncbi:Lacal_2735 family protein [Winogradskyella tangerina]|uniref:Lacal_2735 family protein n=1 Tax=Winogradskyella tangerina TaxID=2023240 RepID=UPI000DBE4C3F|nr:Lacal_2735 family protein [Winogradskyella tangerina]
MSNSEKLLRKQSKLKQKYLQLIEDAYNLRQSDHALSDISEYRATIVLHELNKLKFIIGESAIQAN